MRDKKKKKKEQLEEYYPPVWVTVIQDRSFGHKTAARPAFVILAEDEGIKVK